MIDRREKPEEYRDVKEFWIKRLFVNHREYFELQKKGKGTLMFSAVKFARGGHFHPSIPQMLLSCEGIELREGRQEWGAEPGKKYFVIKLGDKIL